MRKEVVNRAKLLVSLWWIVLFLVSQYDAHQWRLLKCDFELTGWDGKYVARTLTIRWLRPK